MRAVVATALGSTVEEALQCLETQIRPIPSAPSSRELIVKVEYAALNFFDGLILTGKYQNKMEPPFIPGTEFSGTVTRIGSKVTHFAVGDRVCGFPSYMKGTFCEYTTAGESQLWKIPSHMSLQEAACFVCTYGTSYMALVQRANINASNTVLVTAASGGVGTACVQIAKAIGCKTIIGCVGSESKARTARQCGADEVINYRETPQWSQYLKKNKIGIDVFADIVGGDAWNQGLKCMNMFGKAIVIGFAGGEIQKIKANRVLLKNIDVVGVAWGATQYKDMNKYRASVSGALQMYQDGLLHPIIGNLYTSEVDGIRQAYLDLMNRKSVGKLLIKISNSKAKL
eukprot:180789_1